MANPMYRQIAEDLRSRIESGDLQPGQQLRTELELREHYNASRNTVRDAIKWLTNLGLVETRPGQGTFVVQKIDPFVITLSGDPSGPRGGDQSAFFEEVSVLNRTPAVSSVQVEIQQASGEVAAGLRIPEGTEVISRHERRFIDGIPWSMQTSFYPAELVDRGARRLLVPGDIAEGTVQYLTGTLHIRQVGYCDCMIVRAPNPIEADFFSLPSDGRVAVCEIWRTAFEQAGVPMRLTVTVYPTDRNQFRFYTGEVPEPHYRPSPEDQEAEVPRTDDMG